METISKTDEFKEKIEIIVKEFASDLKNASLTGYSLFEFQINKGSDGFTMKTHMGLMVILNGEEVAIGADVDLKRGGQRSSKEYAKILVDYSLSKGRDFTIKYYDECSNNPSNKGSINDIKLTDILFGILYQMTETIYQGSPMPMFG